ncbi:MAG: hypothetical protein FWB86_11305 [Treponema sp.]|nr:hypothetical protein [Treponema sp.]
MLPEFNKWLNIITFEYEPDDIEYDRERNPDLTFITINNIHIYFHVEYDDEKKNKIIDYINNL